jgi:hypothetical protein
MEYKNILSRSELHAYSMQNKIGIQMPKATRKGMEQ